MTEKNKPIIIFVCFGKHEDKLLAFKGRFRVENKIILCDTKELVLISDGARTNIPELNNRNDFSGYYFGLRFALAHGLHEFDSGFFFANDTLLEKRFSKKQHEKIVDIFRYSVKKDEFLGQIDRARCSSSFLPKDRRYLSTYLFGLGELGVNALIRSYEFVSSLGIDSWGVNFRSENLDNHDLSYIRYLMSVIDGSNSRVRWSGREKYKNISQSIKLRKLQAVINEHLLAKLVREQCRMRSLIKRRILARLIAATERLFA